MYNIAKVTFNYNVERDKETREIISLEFTGFSHKIVTYDENIAFRKFTPECFILIAPPDRELREQFKVLQDKLDNIVDNGYDFGGRHYLNPVVGAGKARNGEFILVDEKVWPMFLSWAMLQLALWGQPAQKISKYLALVFSVVRTFEEAFGPESEIQEPPVEDWLVLKDIEVPVEDEFDVVTLNNVKREKRVSTNKITDGSGFFVVDDTNWSRQRRRDFIRDQEGFTVRAKFIKGAVTVILLTTLKRLVKYLGYSGIVKDYWGLEKDITTAKFITFASVVKCSKSLKSWKEYVDGFVKCEDEMYVCVRAHTHLTALPYQQHQTLLLTEEETDALAHEAVDKLINRKMLTNFGPKELREVLKIYPELFRFSWVWQTAQCNYSSKRRRAAGGRIPSAAHAPFVQNDIMAILSCVISGGEKVVRLIPKNCVVCSSYKTGTKLSVTRCPHLDNAHLIRIVVEIPDEWKGFFIGHTVFISSLDNGMVWLQADFDGDHLYLTDHPIIVRAAERAHEAYDDRAPLYAAVESEQAVQAANNEKEYLEQIKERVKKSFSAPIGIYAMALVNVWSNVNFWDAVFHEKLGITVWQAIVFLTRKANTCIDEAGAHGADDTEGMAEEIIKVMNKEKTKRPAFHAYVKASISKDGRIGRIFKNKDGSEKVFPPENPKRHEIVSTSNVDRYSRLVLHLMPPTFEEAAEPFIKDAIHGDPDRNGWEQLPNFDYRMLMSTYDRSFKGMTVPGLYKADYKDCGLWQTLSQNLGKLAKQANNKIGSFHEQIKAEAISAIESTCERTGKQMVDCIDYLVKRVFDEQGRTTPRFTNEVLLMWITFGDVLVENLKRNLNVDAIIETNVDNEDYDELDVIDMEDEF